MDQPVVFTYWPRRAGEPRRPACARALVAFEEQVEYVLSFEAPLSPRDAQRLRDLGGALLDTNLALLSFGNFVGRAELAQVAINVESHKLAGGGVSRLLQEISELASTLVFGWRAPIGFQAATDKTRQAPVPYHQLQLLRRLMLAAESGRRLQDWLSLIERHPTRRIEPERPVLPVDRVRRLDHRAVQSIFSRLDRLVPIPSSVPILSSPLATNLTFGTPPKPHFPSHVAAPRGRLSFDTVENRFVKHVVRECLALVYRFVDHPKLYEGLKSDCRKMLGILENAASCAYLDEAGVLSSFRTPSQALAKANGYREIFSFWSDFTRHVSLPATAAETNRLLDGRDMAKLYEYWVFLKLFEAVARLTPGFTTGIPKVERDELGESLSIAVKSTLGPDIAIRFNATFKRSDHTAYSTPLRPDVSLKVGREVHVFDAKYRLNRFDAAETDSDDDGATYKRADLYKMHSYRDAINCVKTAFVVYPGTEFVFFERSGMKRVAARDIDFADGVGAVPMRPDSEEASIGLLELLRRLLSLPAPIQQI
jgi:hypothetical protein